MVPASCAFSASSGCPALMSTEVWLVPSASFEPRAGTPCWPYSPSALGCLQPSRFNWTPFLWLLHLLSRVGPSFFSLKEWVAPSESALRYLYTLMLPFCSVCWPWNSAEDTDSLAKVSPGEARTSSGCPRIPLECPGSLTLWPWSGYLTFDASVSSAVKQKWK